MIKTLFFIAALALSHAAHFDALDDEESCETLDNGCPADFDVHKLLPHEYSCWRYYSCSNGDKILMRCPRGLVFDPEEELCVSGGTDRDCINDERSATVEDDSPEREDIELLPNGCPANYSYSLYLPHEHYCNMYYQCNFGGKLPMICGPGTHFNPAEGVCDHISIVGCTLPGGNFVPTTTPAPEPTPPLEFDKLPNGCPRNGSITWLLPHETNCSLFYSCVWGGLVQLECPGNTHFNPSKQECDSPANAGCAANPCNNPCGGSCDSTDPPCPTETPTTTTTTSTSTTTTTTTSTTTRPTTPTTTSSSTSTSPTTTTTSTTTTEEPDVSLPNDPEDPEDPCPGDNDPDKKCEEDCNILPWGHDDCDKYWTCYGNKAVLIVCSEGLHFNPSTNTCDFACNAGCVRENIQATSSHDGIKLYLPWNKIDENTKELLKLIAY